MCIHEPCIYDEDEAFKYPGIKSANVLMVLNCSLSPAPESIVHYVWAQETANKVGIKSTLSICTMKTVGFLPLDSATKLVVNDPTFTHLMIISDDTVCDNDLIIKLVNDDKDIVSGIYRVRDPYTSRLAIYGDGSEDFDTYVKNGSLVKSKFCSSHTMMVKRDVLIAVANKFPELNYINEKGDQAHGSWVPYIKDNKLYCDDWAFSKRAKEAGFECWIDFSVKLQHRCSVWLGI